MKEILLGKNVAGPRGHDPSILTPIPRRERGVTMYGFDLWRSYELSWLTPTGPPRAAVLELIYPLTSENLIESKSLKLYLNGLAYERFAGADEVAETIRSDLAAVLAAPWVRTGITLADELADKACAATAPGFCIDRLDVPAGDGAPMSPSFLVTGDDRTEETLCSNLLRSLCPITGQPDWGTLVVQYRGPRLDRAGLLRYVCSLREHQAFHEQCCEQIFTDITTRCRPRELTVSCWYNRRGGIDINPIRSSHPIEPDQIPRYRLPRQ